MSQSGTITCRICGEATHHMQLHLTQRHPSVSLEQYRAEHPDAPIMSEAARKVIAEKEAAQQQASMVVDKHATGVNTAPAAASEVFTPHNATVESLFKVRLANLRGEALACSTYTAPASLSDMVPEIDPDHYWGDGEDLRYMLMALETNMPLYIYGHKGTGKTTDVTQICARTGRPMMRVQHTRNTEEFHLVGQTILAGNQTVFEYGPLAVAMREGLVYLADEYDVAQPGALAVYQPVLEGEPLVIKEAPRHMRVIKPHPLFRFVATGNTNGTGDRTGLYTGTMLQNSANYDRFQMTIQKVYMDPAHEQEIVIARTGVKKDDAKKLVDLATEVRKQFDAGKMSDTISTRSLVTIATIGRRRANMGLGIKFGWSNKLNPTDREAVVGIAQRFWG